MLHCVGVLLSASSRSVLHVTSIDASVGDARRCQSPVLCPGRFPQAFCRFADRQRWLVHQLVGGPSSWTLICFLLVSTVHPWVSVHCPTRVSIPPVSLLTWCWFTTLPSFHPVHAVHSRSLDGPSSRSSLRPDRSLPRVWPRLASEISILPSRLSPRDLDGSIEISGRQQDWDGRALPFHESIRHEGAHLSTRWTANPSSTTWQTCS